MGFASLCMLTPYLLVGPFAGSLATRYPPDRVRLVGFMVQAFGYGGAAAAVFVGLPVPAVVGMAAIGAGAATTMRPTAAIVLPAIVRTSRELTVGNVWEGHSETVSQLGGAIASALLLGAFGPASVIATSGALTFAAASVLLLPRPIASPPRVPESDSVRSVALALSTIRELRARRGALTVLAIAGAQFLVLGAQDIIIVVLAEDTLELSESGAGWLYAAVGLGAVVSGGVATRLSRNARQAPAIACALAANAAVVLVLGWVLSAVSAVVLLAMVGLTRSLIDVLARILLHRSIRPERLGSVYALLEFASGVGLLLGSLLAQVAVGVGGPRLALVAVGAVLVATLLLSWRGLRCADDAADVPVTTISLLRRVPLFAPLPCVALEDVARSATERRVSAGTPLIRQGDVGDEYFVVADGSFEVIKDGQRVATVQRGGGFGEIALLDNIPRTATVMACRDSTVLTIPRQEFLVATTQPCPAEGTGGAVAARAGSHVPDGAGGV
jgi:MFS family permease